LSALPLAEWAAGDDALRSLRSGGCGVSFPKPIKRSTAKRKKTAAKNANISAVRDRVEELDGEQCRIEHLLNRFGFVRVSCERLELAHLKGRQMGGNPTLDRDTPENTMLVSASLHQGPRSMHSGHLRIRPLTTLGTRGPCGFEFFEKFPREIKSDDPSYD
jgi:hypothetical protein